MVKKEIIEKIAEKTGLNKILVKKVVDEFLSVVSDTFREKERVELRKFGVFYFKKRKKKIGRNLSLFNGSLDELWDMDQKVRSMIKASTDVYIKNDSDLAYKICEEDDKVDKLCKSLFESTIKIIKEKEDLVNDGAQLLFIIKYLERVADHVTNICEWTIFSKEGNYVDLNE